MQAREALVQKIFALKGAAWQIFFKVGAIFTLFLFWFFLLNMLTLVEKLWESLLEWKFSKFSFFYIKLIFWVSAHALCAFRVQSFFLHNIPELSSGRLVYRAVKFYRAVEFYSVKFTSMFLTVNQREITTIICENKLNTF